MEFPSFDEIKSAVDAREALIQCFIFAHRESMEIDEIDEEMSAAMAKEVVKKAFKKNGDDFENPNKASLTRAVEYLQNFSKAFRDSEIIKKHAHDMIEIINQLDD